MKINEIMTRNVEVVQPNSVLQEAAGKMKSLNVGSLPVCDNRKLLGIITDRDIAIRAVADGRDPATTKVSETMSPDLVYCFEDQDIKDAANLMERHQIRRLPILDRNQQLVGIVSLGDLAVETKNKLSGEVLEEVSEPAKPRR